MAEITLRPITEADEEFLCRVYAATRQEEMALSGWEEGQIADFLRQQFNLQHAQYRANYPGAAFDVILEDKVPAGRLYVHRRPDEIRIVDIALLPEHRGRGIGSRLLAALIGEAEGRGVTLSLHVEIMNPALAFYQRLGFEAIEQRGVYLFMGRKPRGEEGG